MRSIWFVLTLGMIWWTGLTALAQSTNGTITLTQDTLSSAGGPMGTGNPLRLTSALGDPVGGRLTNATVTIISGYAPLVITSAGPNTIRVEGTMDDTTATVTVSAGGGSASGGNGLTAVITGQTFRADQVPLTEGANTITAIATDPAGNQAIQSITVYLSTRPPARPTVAATPAVTTQNSATLSGTKTPGTSLWINEVEIVPLNNSTTWTKTVTLQEGDNVFVIVAKNAAGVTSASNTVNIVVDTLPPVLTVTVQAKTNLNPYPLTGAVDDSLTTVTVNGIAATRSGKNVSANVPLAFGPNTIAITATSPKGYVSTQTHPITLEHLPVLLSMQPTDGTKIYSGSTLTIQGTATDQENQPLQYQVRLDGQVLRDWASSNTYTWTPTAANAGLHTIELRVRDTIDGYASRRNEVLVLRPPVSPP